MSKNPSKPKPQPNFGLLLELKKLGYRKIVGIDEVGRGAIAGPLVVAAVELNIEIADITDSKLLSPLQREILAHLIHQQAAQISFGLASVAEINQIGLAGALKLAYQRAIEDVEADLFLTDYLQLPGYKFITQPQGDRYFYPTAAASIVAKVYRDQLMSVYGQIHPEYHWHQNAGYGTVGHFRAIKTLGPTPLHRLNFLIKKSLGPKGM